MYTVVVHSPDQPSLVSHVLIGLARQVLFSHFIILFRLDYLVMSVHFASCLQPLPESQTLKYVSDPIFSQMIIFAAIWGAFHNGPLSCNNFTLKYLLLG